MCVLAESNDESLSTHLAQINAAAFYATFRRKLSLSLLTSFPFFFSQKFGIIFLRQQFLLVAL